MQRLGDLGATILEFVREPILGGAWFDGRGFWLNHIFDDRFVVVYALPLALILLLLRDPIRLRVGIVLTGIVFLTYILGAAYAAFWLLVCVGFYFASEKYAAALHRSNRAPSASERGFNAHPALFAGGLIVAWWIGSESLKRILLPGDLADWLWTNARWVYPLGRRGFEFEAEFLLPHTNQPFPAIFWNTHNIGAAYLTMRMLHYFIELKRGTIPTQRRSLLNFLAYLCYAPNLIQGPIERYARFQDEIDTCPQRRSWDNLGPALGRISWGIAKGVIATLYFLPTVADYLMGPQIYYKHPERIGSYAFLYFGVYIHIFWLYLEFSGYCDVSAGIARLLGYRQVENFNWPWLATSLRDFWRRWHISLSSLLRDYLYIPLGGNRRHVTLNLIITFALCGIWHSLRFDLAVWGAVMGGMLAVNQVWAHWMARIDAGPDRPMQRIRRGWLRLAPLPQICAWVITMHFFVHSLLIFFGGQGVQRVYWELIRRPLGL